MKIYKVGYTQGTFDLFHIGHLNLLKHAKEQCEKLIVGVNSDTLVFQYKNKNPIIKEQERIAIVESIKFVDDVILCSSLDKLTTWQQIHYDAIFIGDDWKGNERWKNTEQELNPLGVHVVYLAHTEGISSTILRNKI